MDRHDDLLCPFSLVTRVFTGTWFLIVNSIIHIMLAVLGVSLLAVSVTAVPNAGRSTKRQSGPVDPGTASDCTYFETALDSTYTCAYYEDSWGLSHADFVDWVSCPNYLVL